MKEDMVIVPENFSDMVSAKPSQGMNRSADQVRAAMRVYVDAGRIDDEGLETFMRLFILGKQRGYDFDHTGKLVNYSGSTLSRLFAGKYDGNLQQVAEQFSSHLEMEAEREKMRNDLFIENSIWRDVSEICELAQKRNSPVRLVGPSQIGKTFCLKEFQRRSKMQVCYCRVPAAPTFKLLADEICDAVGVPTSLRVEDARLRVKKAIGPNTLLIIDELHELAISAGKGTAMKCMEWLREIYDKSKCGMVLCGTRTMEDDLINDPKIKGWLAQMNKRCIRVLNLPNRIPDDDIDLAAKAYGITGSKACVENLLKSIDMNRLTTCLAVTVRWCNTNKHQKTWEVFRKIYKKTFGTEV